MTSMIDLNGQDWQFKEFYGEDWSWRDSVKPATRDVRWWRNGTVPGSVHHDLLKLGEIPNPYYERNSLLCEWIPARTWIYKKSFHVENELRGKRIHLHFEGVDYQARFFLNGIQIGEHIGMYTPAVFEVTEYLEYGQENLIAVVIEAAPLEQPQVGYTSRVQTVKSRMTYWWDFCPRMVHLGIWDNVYLSVTDSVRIKNVFVRPQLSGDLDSADISISVDLDSSISTDVNVESSLSFAGSIVASCRTSHTVTKGAACITVDLHLDHPHLWWPNGYGDQPLYEAEICILVDGVSSASHNLSFGIRQISLIANENADPEALPYTFVVNGRKIFIKGWNWVPLDVMYGVPRPEKLERLLTLAQRAHVSMLRVWGGGLIEQEAFYNLCDRLGLMVWQEFIQSSSGIDNHPSISPAYIDLLTAAAEEIVPRKRNHPSLAVWCGGNELQSGSEKPLDDHYPTLSALKEIVRRLDPDRLWLPTSSSGRVFSNSLENIAADPSSLHDVHGPWEYQGVENQYTLYNQGSSLFHSEFGVEGITNLRTLNITIAPEHQTPVTLNNAYWFHLGAWWVKRPRWDQTFGELSDVETLVRATQWMQADGLRYALEADRRRKYHSSGTLPWQFNEPYPMAACTSAVDYYAQPKPVYYAVAQAYSPLHVSAKFVTLAWQGRSQFSADIWVCNSELQPLSGCTLRVRVMDTSGCEYFDQSVTIDIPANQAVQLSQIQLPITRIQEDVFFLDLQLADPSGNDLSSNRYIFSRTADAAPLLNLPQTKMLVKKGVQEESVSITNIGGTAALYIWLEDDRPLDLPGYIFFSENYFCLFPGETKNVSITWQDVPLAERSVRIKGWNTNEHTIKDWSDHA